MTATPQPPPPPPPPPPPKKASGRDDGEKQARMAIGRIHRGLRSLRGLFIMDAILIGIVFLASFGTDSTLFKLIAGGLFVGAVAGAILVVYKPLPWCIAIATGHTLLALIAPTIVTIGIAVLLWWAVKVALDANTLMRLYPDAWEGPGGTYTGRSKKDVGSKWQERAKADRQKRTRNVLLFVVLPLVLLIAGAILFGSKDDGGDTPTWQPPVVETPTESVEPHVQRFADAWNASDFEAVMELVHPEEQSTIRKLVSKVIRRRNWANAHPNASTGTLEEYDPAHYYAWHDLEGYGRVRISWEWADGRWTIVRFKFKKES